MLQSKRKEKGLSQSQLSKASGVNLRTIQSYECGRSNLNNATLSVVCALADALDCKVSDLLTDPEIIEVLSR